MKISVRVVTPCSSVVLRNIGTLRLHIPQESTLLSYHCYSCYHFIPSYLMPALILFMVYLTLSVAQALLRSTLTLLKN